MRRRREFRLILMFVAACCLWPLARAATIFQAANATYVAWEAEDTLTITNSSPTTFVVTADATAGGGQALYLAGVNNTAFPSSIAQYAIRFRTAGTYTLFLRWRADKSFTDLDPNSGNSYYRPNDFGTFTTNVANFATSTINNSRTPPAVNSYAMSAEALQYTVTQEQVDAGAPVILTIGTREAGLYLDRFILSLNTLVEADFNAIANSDTDVIPQGTSDTFVAWEAERVSSITSGTPTTYVVTNDATASGNQALYQAGVNNTGFPSSVATYAIRFRSAGTYTLYLRWRAEKSFTDLDPNSGNSYYRPNDFGLFDTNVSHFATSTINNSRTPPAVNSYAMSAEALQYTVSQAQVDAGVPVIFTIGTREAGLYLDRFALSLNTLTESDFNALPNSGAIARPGLLKAAGSAALNTVTVTFDRPLDPASIAPGGFTLSGGVVVTGATLNPNTSRDVILTTAAQTQGTSYTVTVNGVKDVNGTAISANSKINFTAWKQVNGWITRELYYNVTGSTIDTLTGAATFPDAPDAVDFVKAVSIGTDLQQSNFGARFRGYFVPAQSGAYEFYLYADDDAQLSLSSDATADNLTPVLGSTGATGAFDPNVEFTSANLTGGQKYLFQVLYKQDTAAAAVGLSVRKVGASGDVTLLPALGGTQVSTFINPDAGAVNITKQPASTTVAAGQRAKFVVTATAPKGGTLFYQWQVNQVDIPGATRPTYITPVLSAGDSGKKYRCVIGVNGTDVPSQEATLTVGPAIDGALQPYVAINFAGGAGAGTTVGASLATNDIAGVIPQGNFNNVPSNVVDGSQPLVDADGAATPVTVAVYDPANQVIVNANATIGTGTGAANTSADHLLMQGSLANNGQPLSILLSGIPAGKYALIVYSVGFSFNSTYEEDFDLFGADVYPKITGQGETATEFIANPTYVRISSTDPTHRDHGNYAEFDNVSPADDGTLLLTVEPQSANVGNTAYFPPINGLQLVKAPALPLKLTVQKQGAGAVVSWGADAVGFTLQSSATIGTTASWSPVAGAPNPIAASGSANVTVTANAQFYRLAK